MNKYSTRYHLVFLCCLFVFSQLLLVACSAEAPPALAAATPPQDPTGTSCVSPFLPGLRSWWAGDGDTNDLFGRSLGVLGGGVTFTSGKVQQAFNFQGTGSSIQFPDFGNLSQGDEFTTEMWLLPGIFQAALLQKGGTNSFTFRAWIDPQGHIQLVVPGIKDELPAGDTGHGGHHPPREFTKLNVLRSTQPLIANDWNHIALIVSLTTGMKIYLNGVLVGAGPILGGEPVAGVQTGDVAFRTNTEPLNLGGASGLSLGSFKGMIDEVGFYNRALTEAEVTAIANAGAQGKCKPDSGGEAFTAVPEFAAVRTLLAERQAIHLGVAAGMDTPCPNCAGTGSSLLHFQFFKPNWATCTTDNPGIKINSNPPVNSIEMHSDGSIYVAFQPPCSPTWYDTLQAHESPADVNKVLSAGRNLDQSFAVLKDKNVLEARWEFPEQAFPKGRGPVPRWISMRVRPGISPDSWAEKEMRQIVRATRPLLHDSRLYCFKDTMRKGNLIGYPGQWQPVLPVGEGNGQKKFFRDHAVGEVVGGVSNHFVAWRELLQLSQSDPNKTSEILEWNGHPNSDDLSDRTIPWMFSGLEGTVTNSFLSGGDFTLDHREAPNWVNSLTSSGQPTLAFDPNKYWLGSSLPTSLDGCTAFYGPLPTGEVTSSLCNDWDVFVAPDPAYKFMAASTQDASDANCCEDETAFRGFGNFDTEHKGNLETEVEQWLVPVGYRPEPGDRIFITGRYAVDCGHSDWHAELHPIQSYVSSHEENSPKPGAIGNVETVATVVVTGAWEGNTLDFDLWPARRPTPISTLRFEKEPCCHDTQGQGVGENVSIVQERLEPAGLPNHLHVTIVSRIAPASLTTDRRGQVEYELKRRLAVRYHLWWVLLGPTGSHPQ